MVDAALNVAAEQVIEYSAYGALLERDGNRGPTAAPQNLYRTNEIDEFGRADCWVAVAVATDEQWAGLCEALGRPDWATDPELRTAEGRRAHHDVIDEHLAAWCEERTGDDIVDTLWEHGVPVAKVMQPHRQTEIAAAGGPRLLRGRRAPGERPHAAQHPAVHVLARPGARPLEPAPLLGQHNHELLSELGLTDEEIADLEAQGVIGNAPGDGAEQGQDGLASTGGHRSVQHPAHRPRRGGDRRGRGHRAGYRRRWRRSARRSRSGSVNADTCARRLRKAIGALGIVADVRDSEQVDAALQRTVDELGEVSILVNNAGGVFNSPLLDTTENGWDALYKSNLRHVLLCTQRVTRAWSRPACPAASST